MLSSPVTRLLCLTFIAGGAQAAPAHTVSVKQVRQRYSKLTGVFFPPATASLVAQSLEEHVSRQHCGNISANEPDVDCDYKQWEQEVAFIYFFFLLTASNSRTQNWSAY